MIVLDTNVLSELARPNAEAAVLARANAQQIAELYTTAITEAEILVRPRQHASRRRQEDLQRAGEIP